MSFTQTISFANQAPKGWEGRLTLEEYYRLEAERRNYYKPLYAKYRTKKVRDYEDCDLGHTHFLGWKEVQIGIGAPISYEYVGYFAAKMIDDANRSNVFMKRIMGKWDDSNPQEPTV